MLTSIAIYSIYRYCNGDKGESSTVEEKRAAGSSSGTRVSMNYSTIGLCSLYMLVGPVLILLNKFILSNLHFPYPLFLSALGVSFSAIVARVMVMLGLVKLQRKEAVSGVHYLKRVMPVGFFHAATLSFGNLVYLYLNVGFIQMLKSFTPVIILVCSTLTGLEFPSQMTILSIAVISVGTAVTSSFVPELSIVGLGVMFMSELSEAIRLLMTQFLLQNLKFGVIEGQYVLAPAAAFWLGCAACIFEGQKMVDNGAFAIMAANPAPFFVASALGLCVNFLSYLVIQTTSSLTMKVLGTARTILTICVGVVIWGENIGLKSMFGYGLSLAGFVSYNLSKMRLKGFVKITLPVALTSRLPILQAVQDKLDSLDALRARWDAQQAADQHERDKELGMQSEQEGKFRFKGSEASLEELDMTPMAIGGGPGMESGERESLSKEATHDCELLSTAENGHALDSSHGHEIGRSAHTTPRNGGGKASYSQGKVRGVLF